MTSDRTTLIKRLHIAKRDLGLDDDLYRDKLEQLTGMRSARDMTDDQLRRAVAGFRGQGAAAEPKSAARLGNFPQARMIQALWVSLYNLGAVRDGRDSALLAFVRRQTGSDALVWVKRPGDIAKVVEGLKDWLVREGVNWDAAPSDAAPWRTHKAARVCEAQWAKLLSLSAVTRQRIYSRVEHLAPAYEGLADYAMAVARGRPTVNALTNADWAQVSKALGKKLRAALAQKEKAA